MEHIIRFLQENSFLIKLLMAAAEIAVGFVLAPMIKRGIMKLKLKGVDPAVLTFTSSGASILVKFLAVVIALAQLGVDISVVVGAFSAIGLGVSLAMKESMANVAGGLQILITRPFTVGDFISVSGSEGTCKKVELMFTVLETVNRQQIIIPNATLVSNTIINYTEYPIRRIVISVPAAIQGDYTQFRARVLDLLMSDGRILKDPKPKTVIAGFRDTGKGININVVAFVPNPIYWDVFYELNGEIQKLVREEGIQQPVEVIQVEAEETKTAPDSSQMPAKTGQDHLQLL